MATTPTVEESRASAPFNPRSPWFWLVAGMFPVVAVAAVIGTLTVVGGPLPERPDVPIVPGAEGSYVGPRASPQEKQAAAVEQRLVRLNEQLRQNDKQRERLLKALAEAEAAPVGFALRANILFYQELLKDLDSRRDDLLADKLEATAQYRALTTGTLR